MNYRVDRAAAGLLIGFLLLGGCEDAITPQVYSRAELIARMQLPDTFPRSALSLSESQVEVEYRNRFGSESDGFNVPVTDQRLVELAHECLEYNPNFENPDELDLAQIASEFDLGLNEVEPNFAEIREVYIAKVRYEMYRSVTYDKSLGGPGERPNQLAVQSPTWIPNRAERRLLVLNPHLAVGTSLAIAHAFSAATAYGGALYADGSRSNAYKHALMNALIVAYTRLYFNTVAGATGWAQRFTDAHELNPSPDPRDRDMDFHNNRAGRNYIASQSSPTKYFGVVGPNAIEVTSALRQKADVARCFRLSDEIDNEYPDELVYFRTNDGTKECSGS